VRIEFCPLMANSDCNNVCAAMGQMCLWYVFVKNWRRWCQCCLCWWCWDCLSLHLRLSPATSTSATRASRTTAIVRHHPLRPAMEPLVITININNVTTVWLQHTYYFASHSWGLVLSDSQIDDLVKTAQPRIHFKLKVTHHRNFII